MKKILFVAVALSLSTGFAKNSEKKEITTKDFLKSRNIAQSQEEGQKCGNLATYPAIECFSDLSANNNKLIDKKLNKMILALKKDENIFDRESKLEILSSYTKTVNSADKVHCAFANYSEEGGSLQRLGYAACIYEGTVNQLAELDLMPLEAR